MQLYTEGYLVDDFFEQDIKISKTVSKMLELLSDRLDKSALLNVSKKQAQYLALQNQINPHFLYNTLEGIRSEALCAGMDGVAAMTEALATFFRYTISNVDHLVTLEDELSNIENYYIIQQYRFGDKLSLSIEYDDDDDDLSVLNLKLPKLILQPIVENSIYHGIERKVGKGNLRIHIDHTIDRLIIRISDDGMGIEKVALEKLNNKLLTNSLDDIEPKKEKKGGIAIINVNNRIKLIFGEEYGIHIYSTQNVGTDVEITLPIIKE
jgi:two-component system sensor histidine kinase YesM